MLFTAWLRDPFRPTQDLDLLSRGDEAIPVIRAAFLEIFKIESGDGLVFDSEALRIEPIREHQPYGGVRLKTMALLGQTQIPVQVDIGFGDKVTPEEIDLIFPTLLTEVEIRLKAYPRETVVAEKLEAITKLGPANSRMKDFYDLYALSTRFSFEGDSLRRALQATFARRQTKLEFEPYGLSEPFAQSSGKKAQWRAFIQREPLVIEAKSLDETIETIRGFVQPVIAAAAQHDELFRKIWPAAGPWILADPDENEIEETSV